MLSVVDSGPVNLGPHVFTPKSNTSMQLITTTSQAWQPNSHTWCGFSISLVSLDLCTSYLDQCSSFQARCRPVFQCWRVLAEGVDSPTSPHPRPQSRTFHNLMRKMTKRGETVESLEYFHNSSSSIPPALAFLLSSPKLPFHNTRPFQTQTGTETLQKRSVTSVRFLPWLADVPAPCLADVTCILCHSSILAGALVRQHAEHPKANHSGSVIWVTVSSSAPISSPTLQQALT